MSKNKVSDLITDQEMAFARLVLSGTMTDHAAAQAAGLNPGAAAYTKAKPSVRAYMLGYRAAMQQQLLDQEAEQLHRQKQRREQVLDRLWELAKLGPEITRNSITGQVKAISMIAAIEGLIPDRRAGSSEKKTAPPLPPAEIYQAAWLGRRQEKAVDPQPDPTLAQEEDGPNPLTPEHAKGAPGLAFETWDPPSKGPSNSQNVYLGKDERRPAEPEPAAVADVPPPPAMPIGPAYDRSQSVFANLFHPADTTPWAPQAPVQAPARDTRVPFFIAKNRFGRRR